LYNDNENNSLEVDLYSIEHKNILEDEVINNNSINIQQEVIKEEIKNPNELFQSMYNKNKEEKDIIDINTKLNKIENVLNSHIEKKIDNQENTIIMKEDIQDIDNIEVESFELNDLDDDFFDQL
jgi:hypothetical protein